MKRILLAAAVLGLWACGGGDAPTPPAAAVDRVEVTGTPAENVLLVGATVQLSAAARDAGGAVVSRAISWSSSNTAVATVSSSGLVTAVSTGVAAIVAQSGGESEGVAIVVRVPVSVPPTSASAPVTTALLDNTLQLTLLPGASTTPVLTIGRGVVITNDARLLTSTAFAIGPAGVTFARPASVEVTVNLATVPASRRAGLRLFRADEQGGLEPVVSSAVDVTRGVVTATLARGGTYLVVMPGDPATLVAPEGDSRRVEVGASVPGIVVQARDAAGNPVPGATVTFSVEGTAGRITGDTTAVTGIDGVAMLRGSWIAGPAKGLYALRARIVGTPLSVRFQATAITNAVRVAIRAAPTVGSSGVMMTDPIIVELLDAFGDRAEATQPVNLSLLGAGGTLDGTTESLAVLGGVIFQGQRIIGAGTFRIVASSAGLRPDTTAPIVVTQEVAFLELLVPPAGARSGVPFTTQPQVELRDVTGRRVVGSTAIVRATGRGGGTLFGTREVRAVDGVARFGNLAVEGAGPVQLAFGTDGRPSPVSADIVVAPAPVGIRLLVGGSPARDLSPGQTTGIALALDLSNRGSSELTALDVTVTWDPARFAYVDRAPGTWRDTSNADATVSFDESQTAQGRLRVTGNSTAATLASFQLALVLLRALPTATTLETTVNATVQAASGAGGVPVAVSVLPMTVTVFGSSLKR